mgnify:CR=1 FL=1
MRAPSTHAANPRVAMTAMAWPSVRTGYKNRAVPCAESKFILWTALLHPKYKWTPINTTATRYLNKHDVRVSHVVWWWSS